MPSEQREHGSGYLSLDQPRAHSPQTMPEEPRKNQPKKPTWPCHINQVAVLPYSGSGLQHTHFLSCNLRLPDIRYPKGSQNIPKSHFLLQVDLAIQITSLQSGPFIGQVFTVSIVHLGWVTLRATPYVCLCVSPLRAVSW